VLVTGVGATRAETQFVVVTGDGLADYLVVDAGDLSGFCGCDGLDQ
jgi:hypothetical protein